MLLSRCFVLSYYFQIYQIVRLLIINKKNIIFPLHLPSILRFFCIVVWEMASGNEIWERGVEYIVITTSRLHCFTSYWSCILSLQPHDCTASLHIEAVYCHYNLTTALLHYLLKLYIVITTIRLHCFTSFWNCILSLQFPVCTASLHIVAVYCHYNLTTALLHFILKLTHDSCYFTSYWSWPMTAAVSLHIEAVPWNSAALNKNSHRKV